MLKLRNRAAAAALAAMLSLETLIGSAAAFCTAIANLPQVIKAWRTHSVGDLSLKMVLLLSAGLALWVVYGLMKGDAVIIIANLVSVALAANLAFFKLKEVWGGARGVADAGDAAEELRRAEHKDPEAAGPLGLPGPAQQGQNIC